MHEEICLLVDETDCIVGRAPKFAAHRVQLEPGVAPLHRAFSLFLIFRDPSTDKPQLLLQKRAASKITFPLQWANSCCSHPIANCPGEAEGVAGVILAACRKAEQELGIPVKLMGQLQFRFLDRVHYHAPMPNSPWGEHEIDYILFAQVDQAVLDSIAPNPDEVAQTVLVDIDQLPTAALDAPFTPWLHKICQAGHLPVWLARFQGGTQDPPGPIIKLA